MPYDREEEITITFLKDDRIYKTITDYGGNAPADLVWAYARLRHLHRWIRLTKLSNTELPAYLRMRFLSLHERKYYLLAYTIGELPAMELSI